jgi:hypothetical protein
VGVDQPGHHEIAFGVEKLVALRHVVRVADRENLARVGIDQYVGALDGQIRAEDLPARDS